MKNLSSVSEFVFTGLPLNYKLQMILLIVLLFLYLIIIIGNLLIISLIYWDCQLHSPMYFFLANISFLEINLSTTVIPNLLATLLSPKKTISFAGCFVQCYLYFLFGTVNFIFLAAMSFDRYVAICRPLHYIIIMSWKICYYIVLTSWIGGLIYVGIPAILKGTLPYCRTNKINHFFCDSTLLLKLACIDTRFIELIDFLMFSFVILTSLILTVVTYILIVIAVFKIPSATGRQKTFSTCISHIFLVCLGYGGTIFIYIVPKPNHAINSNKIVSLITVFITPVLSPFIFTLRNQCVQIALGGVLWKAKHYLYITKR